MSKQAPSKSNVTAIQIQFMRAAYAKVESFPLKSLPAVRTMLGKLSDADLQAVSRAKIKFISSLAVNVAARRAA